MKIIGITGPIGAGKSYVASLISKRGIPDIDTDKVYHELISRRTECSEALEREFGAVVIKADGSVDRKVLGDIVFSNPEKLSKLNRITHKFVTDRVEEMLKKYRSDSEKAVLVEVPLMFESGFDKCCDEVVCVVSDDNTRLRRICERSGMTENEAWKRIKNQKDIDFYIANSTFIVYNNGREDLNVQIDALMERIFKR